MPTRGYIAGKPVSRWEADSDNIDIEYKNLDRPRPQTWCGECFSGRKGQVLKVLLVIVIFFIGLILGYVIRRNVHEHYIAPKLKPQFGVQQDYDESVSKQLRDRVSNKHVDNYLDDIKVLTEKISLSGMGGTNLVIDYVRNMWSTYYFDSVKIKSYSVKLSYPDYINESELTIIDADGIVVFQSHTNASNEHPNYLPFNAYAKSGNVMGDLVYGHYGRVEDFKWLETNGVNVTGNIVLIRYGKIHPANKVKHAEENGAVGVILYCDPIDFTDPDENNLSSSYWLPGWAVHLAQVRYALVGDPSTPEYTSVDGVHHIPDSRASYPKIPVHPISYDDAANIMRHLGGHAVPSEWRGGLNATYNTGPGYEAPRNACKLELIVNNMLERRDIRNIIAVIKGKYEEDQYVIIGAHIDSWTMGTVDAGSGFAILMELARTFSDQVFHKDWKPRRSIIFALWDASKYGHIGAYEWVQEYEKQLGVSAVTYINLDAAVRGDYSFYAEASPLLFDVIYNATKRVNVNNMSVYDLWKDRLPGTDPPNRPWIPNLNGEGDHSPFAYHVGIPSMSAAYTYNIKKYPNLPTYPAYSTLDDTLDYMKSYIDPDFSLHISVTQVVADILLQLADGATLPLDVQNYVITLKSGKKSLEKYKSDLNSANITLDHLYSAIHNFIEAAMVFHKNYSTIDKAKINEFDLHLKNHMVVQLPRAFVSHHGLPDLPQYRNMLISPHPENLNEETVFPGLIAGILEGKKTGNYDMLREQITILTVSLQRGKDILTEDILS